MFEFHQKQGAVTLGRGRGGILSPVLLLHTNNDSWIRRGRGRGVKLGGSGDINTGNTDAGFAAGGGAKAPGGGARA